MVPAARGDLLDPVRHPDLVALGRSLRERMDQTLDAEMAAARAASRRRRSVRDRLLDAEDAEWTIAVGLIDGTVVRGVVDAVGLDHLDLNRGSTLMTVLLRSANWAPMAAGRPKPMVPRPPLVR